MKTLWKMLAGAVTLSVALGAVAAEKTLIKIGTLPWEDTAAISGITQRMLEKKGFKVQVTKFADWGIAFSALSRGDVDVMTSMINYVSAEYWAKNKERLEKVSVVSYGLRDSLVVPAYMPINSIEQLNSIKGQVDAKIIGIEPGSGIMKEARDAIKQYGLQYTLVEGSTTAMVAQLQSAIERKQPIVTMLWQPSWMDQKFKMKYLEDPKGVFPPPQAYYWLAKKGFSSENPRAREVISSVYVPIDDITAMSGAMNDGKSMEEATDAWWKSHTDLINRWSVMAGQ